MCRSFMDHRSLGEVGSPSHCPCGVVGLVCLLLGWVVELGRHLRALSLSSLPSAKSSARLKPRPGVLRARPVLVLFVGVVLLSFTLRCDLCLNVFLSSMLLFFVTSRIAFSVFSLTVPSCSFSSFLFLSKIRTSSPSSPLWMSGLTWRSGFSCPSSPAMSSSSSSVSCSSISPSPSSPSSGSFPLLRLFSFLSSLLRFRSFLPFLLR